MKEQRSLAYALSLVFPGSSSGIRRKAVLKRTRSEGHTIVEVVPLRLRVRAIDIDLVDILLVRTSHEAVGAVVLERPRAVAVSGDVFEPVGEIIWLNRILNGAIFLDFGLVGTGGPYGAVGINVDDLTGKNRVLKEND